MTPEQELLKQAASEIKQLRSHNQLMSARLDMFDKMMLLFETAPPYRGMGMSEDLVWKIERHIESSTHPVESAQ